jgi:S-adenosylmethionine hydrolase
MNSLIAILTDFGLDEPFVGMMKGVIYGINPETKIVDITHGVSPYNVLQGSFFLTKTYKYFPKDTIFLCVVDPGVGTKRKALAIKAGGYYFVGPDNGIFSLSMKHLKVENVVEINNPKYLLTPISDTFHARDMFSPIAAHISKGVPLEEFGPTVSGGIDNLVKLNLPEIKFERNFIRGPVLFSDRFGNLVTSIEAGLLRSVNVISIRIGPWKIQRVSHSYSESPPGKPLAIIGSLGTLEISVNGGSALEKLQDFPSNIVEVYYD